MALAVGSSSVVPVATAQPPLAGCYRFGESPHYRTYADSIRYALPGFALLHAATSGGLHRLELRDSLGRVQPVQRSGWKPTTWVIDASRGVGGNGQPEADVVWRDGEGVWHLNVQDVGGGLQGVARWRPTRGPALPLDLDRVRLTRIPCAEVPGTVAAR